MNRVLYDDTDKDNFPFDFDKKYVRKYQVLYPIAINKDVICNYCSCNGEVIPCWELIVRKVGHPFDHSPGKNVEIAFCCPKCKSYNTVILASELIKDCQRRASDNISALEYHNEMLVKLGDL